MASPSYEIDRGLGGEYIKTKEGLRFLRSSDPLEGSLTTKKPCIRLLIFDRF